jgi:DNA polymerase V
MNAKILGPLADSEVAFPFLSQRIPAGFPSPAADHIEEKISLDKLLNLRAPHVYLALIDGSSMEGAGIYDGDLAIVDKSLEPESGHIIVACLNNDYLCKRLSVQGQSTALLSENVGYHPRFVLEGDDFIVEGVVTYSVRAHGKA